MADTQVKYCEKHCGGGMCTILIIDDNETLLESLRLSFEFRFADCQILTAKDGMDGLDQARKHRPNLILCDTVMPHMDGYEMLRQMHNDPALRLIPFIFLTARSTQEDVDKGRALGANDYLTKPFELAELFAIVEKYLNRT
jgi:CheY-like chemotaxis protein